MHDHPGLYPLLPTKPLDPEHAEAMLEPVRGTIWQTCWEYVLTHTLTPSEGSAFWHGANLAYHAMKPAPPAEVAVPEPAECNWPKCHRSPNPCFAWCKCRCHAMKRRKPAPPAEVTTEEEAVIRRTSTDALLTTAYQLTHRMHAARGTDKEYELRLQRDVITAEVKRRCES